MSSGGIRPRRSSRSIIRPMDARAILTTYRYRMAGTTQVAGIAPEGSPIGSGPTRPTDRALAPDLARGAMLLFIALANSHTFLASTGSIRTYPTDGTVLDSITAAILTMVVDGRSYTLFAALFGYGLVQIWHRRERSGADWPSARKLLRRRGRWLILFGFVHGILLFYGDILAAYGLLALIFVGALRWKDRTIMAWSGFFAVTGSLLYGLASLPTPAMPSQPNPLMAMLERAGTVLGMAPFGAFTAACAFLLGVWAARRRVLEDTDRYRPMLRRLVAIGIPVAVLGGLPLALLTSGIVPDPGFGLAWGLGVLHTLTGYLGGPAYAALIALLALRIRNTSGAVVQAVSAVGQRSMTCYLTQSVVWMVLFEPYTLGLSDELGTAPIALVAIATWLVTVLMAEAMRRANQRGPFEVLIRRAVYRAG